MRTFLRAIALHHCLVLLGLAAWIIAFWVMAATEPFYYVTGATTGVPTSQQVTVTSNWKAGLTTLGFSLAGGMCMVAAALHAALTYPKRMLAAEKIVPESTAAPEPSQL